MARLRIYTVYLVLFILNERIQITTAFPNNPNKQKRAAKLATMEYVTRILVSGELLLFDELFSTWAIMARFTEEILPQATRMFFSASRLSLQIWECLDASLE